MPRCRRIAGSCQRRNGLVASSSPIVVGSVGLPVGAQRFDLWRPLLQRRVVGSTVSAKRALDSVYSWPQ